MIARCDRERGEVHDARAGYGAALEILREIGGRYREAHALNGIALCDHDQGEIEDARAGHGAALEIYREIGSRDGEASTLTSIAHCDRDQGDDVGPGASPSSS